MQHLDEGTIHAWLDGALSTEESTGIESHVRACTACAEQVADARGIIAGATRIVSSLDVVRGDVIPAKPAVADRSLWTRLRLTPARAALAATLLIAVSSVIAVQHDTQGNRRFQSATEPAGAPTVGGTNASGAAVVAAASADSAAPSPQNRAADAAKRADAPAIPAAKAASVPAAPVSPRASSSAPSSTAPTISPASAATGAPPPATPPVTPPASPASKAAPLPAPRLAPLTVTGATATGNTAAVRSLSQQKVSADSLRARDANPATAMPRQRRIATPVTPLAEVTTTSLTGATGRPGFARCYAVVGDSALATFPALPSRFAFSIDDTLNHSIHAVGEDGRIGSALISASWHLVSPLSARLDFPPLPPGQSTSLTLVANHTNAQASSAGVMQDVTLRPLDCHE